MGLSSWHGLAVVVIEHIEWRLMKKIILSTIFAFTFSSAAFADQGLGTIITSYFDGIFQTKEYKNLIGIEIEITKDLKPERFVFGAYSNDRFIGDAKYIMSGPNERCLEYVIGGKAIHHQDSVLCTVGTAPDGDINNTVTDTCFIELSKKVQQENEVFAAGTKLKLILAQTKWITDKKLLKAGLLNINNTSIIFSQTGDESDVYNSEMPQLKITCSGPNHFTPMQVLKKLSNKAEFKLNN